MIFMKRFLYCCSLCMVVLFFSGCGGKTLKCTMSNDYKGDITIDRTIIFKFSGDSLSKLTYTTKASFSDDYASAKDSLIESLNDVSYKDFRGVSTSLKQDDNSFEHTHTINFGKLSEDEKKKITIVNYEKKYDEIKNEFVKKEYKCE